VALCRFTRGVVGGSFTLNTRIAFGHGCDCPSYVEPTGYPNEALASIYSKCCMKRSSVIVLLVVFGVMNVAAKLTVQVQEPKQTSGKVVVKLTLKNSFKEKIESVRATVFLLNDQKVVAQATQWVIGGGKDKAPLLPDKITTYNFVINTDKPFTTNRVVFTRIILEGGKQVEPKANVEISK
jgi:hypothetical protein